MSNIFLNEIKKYDISTVGGEELAASELLQKIILAGLSETDFFTGASFHGGTALRIFHGLNRYSQDLDFSLIKNEGKFEWGRYLARVLDRMKEYGCSLELYEKTGRDRPVVIAEVRDLSIGRMLGFEWATRLEHPRKIMVKLEMDTDPPGGSCSVNSNISFPYACTVRLYDMPSLFAGKAHALLCRDYGEYVKGRDWYDFLWYVDKQTEPNYQYLSNALHRGGPWKGLNIKANRAWLEKSLKEKIAGLNIEGARRDVIRFIHPAERDGVNAWDRNTFLRSLDRFTQRKNSQKEIEKDIDWGR